MAATTGVAFIVKSDVAGGTPGQIGGQRNATLNINTGSADLSSKDSSVFRTKARTLYEWDLSFDGLWVESDADSVGLVNDIIAGNLVDIEIALPQTTLTFNGEGIPSISFSAPYDDGYTFTGTITGTGALTRA